MLILCSILRWALKTQKPVLSVDYRKAPEYPYPYAIDECLDLYKILVQSKGSMIGMGRNKIDIVLTGDSAGANISTAMTYRLLELEAAHRLPLPVGLVYAYPALDFDFHAWMTSRDLATLRAEGPTHMGSLLSTKDHMRHKSPLAVVDDDRDNSKDRNGGWGRSLRKSISRINFTRAISQERTPSAQADKSSSSTGGINDDVKTPIPPQKPKFELFSEPTTDADADMGDVETSELDTSDEEQNAQSDRTVDEMIRFPRRGSRPLIRRQTTTLGTRLTMTSRTSFFNDRIIAPTMMRTMALCYVGENSPDLTNNYMISPILGEPRLLEQLPPVYLICGERDPVVDDTLLWAAKIHQAKAQRRARALAKMNRQGDLRMTSRIPDDPIIEQCEDDWAVTRIYSGWSHGFLQMISLMPEAEDAILLLAGYIDQAFKRNDEERLRSSRKTNQVSQAPSDEEELHENTIRYQRRKGSPPTRPTIKGNAFEGAPAPVVATGLASAAFINEPGVSGAASGSSSSPSPNLATPLNTANPSPTNSVMSSFLEPKDVLKRRREEGLLSIATEEKPEEPLTMRRHGSAPFVSRRGKQYLSGIRFH
ncbi:alpha/beta-hydrolase [Atractiella rhizophila]|nr:alpha/beta-hydrolase [Atractiella rhizophila]